jgi:hypothetical protein
MKHLMPIVRETRANKSFSSAKSVFNNLLIEVETTDFSSGPADALH